MRDICKRIMIERSLQIDANSSSSSSSRCAIRPTDLPTENRRWIRHPSFPTPMEEPKKVLKAMYVGAIEVNQPTGMEVLNEAIDKIVSTNPIENWDNVNVSVAPSMISVNSSDPDARLLCECRVRYLSFLGIGKNIRNCAFIMHTAQDKFVAHVFCCEPTSGALCKTVEAACKHMMLPAAWQRISAFGCSSSTRVQMNPGFAGSSFGSSRKSSLSSLSLASFASSDTSFTAISYTSHHYLTPQQQTSTSRFNGDSSVSRTLPQPDSVSEQMFEEDDVFDGDLDEAGSGAIYGKLDCVIEENFWEPLGLSTTDSNDREKMPENPATS
ncbi:conserved hypothetical protein [Culex quinquefasciatus]|uniref:PID domain-containing protein n=1 Tax=Culex quinquefasciatus TaxID=7176 RepID=B0XKA8_CULQU|nr:conserved hypothetical protein [Culex quinquefasciatus]|eukprot:XP_001870080.1 conserved hypothetical protein [Culex quinquefasciatus]